MDPTQRFSDRVENYKRYRPGYPAALLQHLQTLCPPPGPVGDIGSGTGLLTEPLLQCGYEVFGVEPNDAMRAAGESVLSTYAGFTSLKGTAEDLPLADRQCRMVLAAQAFHWFEPQTARRSIARVLAADGLCGLIWNNRETDSTPFLVGYEQALRRYCPDYAKIQATHADEAEIAAFFHPQTFTRVSFPNHQLLDRQAVHGRLLSSSYVPKEGPQHDALLTEINALFEAEARDEQIELRYETVLFHGRLN